MTTRHTPDLNLCTNFTGGPLSGSARARIRAALKSPCQATWDNAYSLVVNGEVGLGLTMWQAVLKVDPGFPRVKPDGPWECVPSRETIIRALNYANPPKL